MSRRVETWTARQCADHLGYRHADAWRKRARREGLLPVSGSGDARWPVAAVRSLTRERAPWRRSSPVDDAAVYAAYAASGQTLAQLASQFNLSPAEVGLAVSRHRRALLTARGLL